MVNRSKVQGTTWERVCRMSLQASLQKPVTRLAEEGIYDRGDLSVTIGDKEVIIECRDRETMQVHESLKKARAKAGEALTIVVWKRKKKVAGKAQRVPVGKPVAILDWDEMQVLLAELDRYRRGNA